jgi:predicted transcriptional regulator
MLTKEKMHDLIDHLPENFSIDDLIDKIIITNKIQIALEQIERGEYLTEEELDEEVKKWQ